MKKQKHPQRIETTVQLKDGAIYCKRWLFFRNTLSVDVDLTSNPKWKKLLQNAIKLPKKSTN